MRKNESRMERMKRRKRKRRIRRTIVLLILLAVAAVSFCLFAPVFDLKTIEVSGNERITAEEIIGASELAAGENVFRINKKETKEKVLRLAYVDTVEVKRALPSGIRMIVTESVPAMLAQNAGSYLLIDVHGKVLEQVADPTGYDLPVLTGFTVTNAAPASKLGIDEPEKFDIIVGNGLLLKNAGLLDQVQEVDVSDILDFKVTLKSGLRVTFGRSEQMDYKISMLVEVLPQIDQSPGAYLDLRVPEKAFYGKDEVTPSPEPEQSGDPEPSEEPEETGEGQ